MLPPSVPMATTRRGRWNGGPWEQSRDCSHRSQPPLHPKRQRPGGTGRGPVQGMESPGYTRGEPGPAQASRTARGRRGARLRQARGGPGGTPCCSSIPQTDFPPAPPPTPSPARDGGGIPFSPSRKQRSQREAGDTWGQGRAQRRLGEGSLRVSTIPGPSHRSKC